MHLLTPKVYIQCTRAAFEIESDHCCVDQHYEMDRLGYAYRAPRCKPHVEIKPSEHTSNLEEGQEHENRQVESVGPQPLARPVVSEHGAILVNFNANILPVTRFGLLQSLPVQDQKSECKSQLQQMAERNLALFPPRLISKLTLSAAVNSH